MANRLSSEFKSDDLGVALKWLRHQAHYTQEQVVEASGQAFSKVFYAQCEQGNRYPSQPKLEAMLSALNTSPSQLQALLEERPWEARGELMDNKPTLRARNLRRGTMPAKSSEPLYGSQSLAQYQAFSPAPSFGSPLGINSRMASLDNSSVNNLSEPLVGSTPDPEGLSADAPLVNAEPLMELEVSSASSYPHFEETTPVSDQEYRDSLARAHGFVESLSPQELQEFAQVFPNLDPEARNDLLRVLRKLSS